MFKFTLTAKAKIAAARNECWMLRAENKQDRRRLHELYADYLRDRAKGFVADFPHRYRSKSWTLLLDIKTRQAQIAGLRAYIKRLKAEEVMR